MEFTTTTAPPEAGAEKVKRNNLRLEGLITRPDWWVLLFFIIVSVTFTWPLATDLSGSLFDRADATDTAWRMGSIAHQLISDPFQLYASNTLYPLKQNLQLDELMVGNGLLFAPLIWLTANPVLAYNLLILSSFALSGFAMWLLVRHLTESSWAGLVAGLIYAFSPWHQAQFAHGGLGAQEWMVFALFFLVLFCEQPDPFKRKSLLYLGLFGLFFDLQILCAGYYAYFIAILCFFYLTYHFFFRSWTFPVGPRSGLTKSRAGQETSGQGGLPLPSQGHTLPAGLWPWLGQKLSVLLAWPKQVANNALVWLSQSFVPNFRRLALQLGLLTLAGILALLILGPFVLPYVQAQQDYGFKRDISETRYWSAAPPSLLRTTPRSWLYKPVERGLLKAQSSGERVMYPGIIALGLALFGLFAGPKASRGLRWTFGLLALTALLLSFGPFFNIDEFGDKYQPQQLDLKLPYFWLYQNIPGFDSLRVPHRFAQLFMLALAVCAGYGVSRVPGFKFQIPGSTHRASYRPASHPQDNLRGQVSSSKFQLQSKAKAETWNLKLGTLVFGLLIGLEFFGPGLPQVATPMGAQAPAMYRWLADEANVTQVATDALLLELPMTGGTSPVNTNPDYLLYSLLHRRPMLNGSINILPPGYEGLYNEVRGFPDERSLDVAEGLGVKFLLVHRDNPALSAANRDSLAKQAGPNGRLEAVKEFGSDVIYRLKPSGGFESLQKLIPPGASVLLGDDTNGKSFYTTGITGLLGNNRAYFSTYQTVYNRQVQPILPNRVYDFAIFYRSTPPTSYGYLPNDLIWQNEVVQVYRKRPTLEAFFNFQEKNSSRYLALNTASPTRLLVTGQLVSQVADSSTATPAEPKSSRMISLFFATPVPQTILLYTGRGEHRVQLEAGFSRYRLTINAPDIVELRTEEAGAVYLLQARLFQLNAPAEDALEKLDGTGGVILQAETILKQASPGTVTTRLHYYTQTEKPAISLPTTMTMQLNITRRNENRSLGEWAIQLPPAVARRLQTLELELDLTNRQAQGQVNNQPVRLYALPLLPNPGSYLATITLVSGVPGSPPANSINRELNRFQFQLNDQLTVSNLSLPPPDAFIILPIGT